MSLINKMLQDLDARGQPSGAGMQVNVKSVVRRERHMSLPLVGGVLLLAVVVVLAGVFGWRYVTHPTPAPRVAASAPTAIKPAPVQPPAVTSTAATVAASAATTTEAVPGGGTGMASAPASLGAGTGLASVPMSPAPAAIASTPAVMPAPTPAPAVAAPIEPAPAQSADAAKAPAKQTRKEKRAEKARLAAEKKVADAKPVAAKAADAKVAAAKAASSTARTAAAAPATTGRQLSTQQRAESEYRRALASLADGRSAEAIAALEQALQIEPRHDAARQTLVGLLIESKRPDDAIRQLQLGLTLDPRQPSLAMLLARLQIERGGSGIDTLTRTLPYAAGNGEYHAFLGGAMQREARHREAAEQYQQALRAAPQNGVWWMGLGISLQAEKRNAEALDAFQKAKSAGSLTPELSAFVDRKLQQLSR
ncbi:MAG TPA: tetratricopeptide repeat protein [Telluria sp.]|nr:tetratricopeptide repeat protein [Telluria sp.]